MVAIELNELATQVQGELVAGTDIVGPPTLLITSALPRTQAIEGSVTLVDNRKHAEKLSNTRAVAVITPERLPGISIPQIIVANPHEAFAKACAVFQLKSVIQRPFGIHPTAEIHSSATVKVATCTAE